MSLAPEEETPALATAAPSPTEKRDLLGKFCFYLHFAIMLYIVGGWAIPVHATLYFYLAFLPAVAAHWQTQQEFLRPQQHRILPSPRDLAVAAQSGRGRVADDADQERHRHRAQGLAGRPHHLRHHGDAVGGGLQPSLLVVMRRLLLAALVCAPLSAAADAPVKDWSPGIETVIVTAHRAGPLLWHVTKGDSSVILLGIVEPLPKDIVWDQSGVRDALKGSRQLLLQGARLGRVGRGGCGSSPGIRIRSTCRTRRRWNRPCPRRCARVSRPRQKIRRDEDRYASLRVPLAGLRLEGDFLKARELTQDEPTDTLKHLAREAGVSARPIAEYEAIPMLKQLPSMPAGANETCLKASLDDVERRWTRMRSLPRRPGPGAISTGSRPTIPSSASKAASSRCRASRPCSSARSTIP